MIKDFQKTAIITKDRKISYNELLQRIGHYAQQISGAEKDRILILGENREGWIYAFFSVWVNRQIPVPVDAGASVHDVTYILNDCKPTCIWTTRNKLSLVQEAIAQSEQNIQVLMMDQEEQIPIHTEPAQIITDEKDTAVIIYTSGTTGNPKGVMLSFENLEANTRAVSDEVPIFNADRRTLILLPLHHILPLMGSVIIPITKGGGVAICPSMSGPDIMDTLCRGQVAIMIGVPRLWQTLYTGIKKKIDASPVASMLFRIAQKINNPALSKKIFSSVHKKMGGHITYCVSGGASLDPEIGKGLRTLGLDVLEGYGMTEAAPMISFTRPGDIIPGCVGLPLPSVECKLVNGELWAKGSNIMQGYYNRPEETAEVIDKDGFLHTGDLARFDQQGRIYITGRSKEIIVLSNGKNIQPSEIEFQLEQFDAVKEAAVVQDNDLLKAIIVPQGEEVEALSSEAIEQKLKHEVIEPYNRSVANYKKVMGVIVYKGELPRTRLEKLQRFKLKEILQNNQHCTQKETTILEPNTQEYQLIKKYLEQEKKISIRPHDHLEMDLALDSLDKVSLLGFVEATFGINMKMEQLLSFKHVQEISEYIANEKKQLKVAAENTDWHQLIFSSTSHLELPNPSFSYPIVAKSFKAFFKAYNRLTVKGKENIPVKGPFILAANHESYMDGPLVYTGLSWDMVKECYSFVTEKHVQDGVTKYLAQRHNIILMERSNLKDSILKLAEVLKMGKNIVIFPEGTRSKTGKMGNFKKTFSILSQELNVPILPVCIRGAYEALPKGKHYMKPSKIEVEYLPLIHPQKELDYQQYANLVRQTILEAKTQKG